MPLGSLYPATDNMLRCGGKCALEHVVCMRQAPCKEQIRYYNRVKQKAEICYFEKHCSLTCDNPVVAAKLDHQQLLLGGTTPSGMLSPVLLLPCKKISADKLVLDLA